MCFIHWHLNHTVKHKKEKKKTIQGKYVHLQGSTEHKSAATEPAYVEVCWDTHKAV